MKSVYRISYLLPIKYWLSAITLNCLFFRASTSVLAFCLLSMTCVCSSLWRRINEAFSVKLSEKYRQILVVYEVYIGIGLKKSYRSSSSNHPHTVAHLCNQFNHVFAVLILCHVLKAIIFTKLGLKLSYYCKIFKHWGLCPQTPQWLPAAGGSASIPKSTTLLLQISGFAPG